MTQVVRHQQRSRQTRKALNTGLLTSEGIHTEQGCQTQRSYHSRPRLTCGVSGSIHRPQPPTPGRMLLPCRTRVLSPERPALALPTFRDRDPQVLPLTWLALCLGILKLHDDRGTHWCHQHPRPGAQATPAQTRRHEPRVRALGLHTGFLASPWRYCEHLVRCRRPALFINAPGKHPVPSLWSGFILPP